MQWRQRRASFPLSSWLPGCQLSSRRPPPNPIYGLFSIFCLELALHKLNLAAEATTRHRGSGSGSGSGVIVGAKLTRTNLIRARLETAAAAAATAAAHSDKWLECGAAVRLRDSNEARAWRSRANSGHTTTAAAAVVALIQLKTQGKAK